MRYAARLDRIPPYPFAELDRKRRAAEERGVKVISLGIGDPDRPTPDDLVRVLCREANNPVNHTYPPYDGLPELRRAAAKWLEERFGIRVDPQRELIGTIGSKEAIAHLVWAMAGPGDTVLVPDPAYPVYRAQTLLSGAEPHLMPLVARNGFFPDLAQIDAEVCRRARLMFINYPNNPTAAVVTREQLQLAVEFCRANDILLCHDAAYSEITFDGYRAPSVLEVPGAKEVAVEVHSLSKPFNMAGWRVGFVAGCAAAIQALSRIKENTDSGQFAPIQLAAAEALRSLPPEFNRDLLTRYQARRDLVVGTLNGLGWRLSPPTGTFYVWVPVPDGFSAESFSGWVLEHAGVVVSPGTSFGEHGEGFVRISLTVNDDELDEALRRLKTHVRYP